MVGSGQMSKRKEKKGGAVSTPLTKREKIVVSIGVAGFSIVGFIAIADAYDKRFVILGVISMALLLVVSIGLNIHSLITDTRTRYCPTCNTSLRLDVPGWLSNDTIKHKCDTCGHCEDTGIPLGGPDCGEL